MIEKIMAIENVGTFRDYHASGDVALRKCSVLYSENGRGKTTLSSILRSLRDSEPSLVLGRRTLGSSSDPRIKIRLDKGIAEFKSETWNMACPGIEIFDCFFVEQNVYTGLTVSLENKRNLLDFVLGHEGVTRGKQIKKIDSDTRKHEGEINEYKRKIRALVPGLDNVDKFLQIERDPEIDDKVQTKEKEVAELRDADRIEKELALELLKLPQFKLIEIEAILKKSIEDISDEAVEATQKYIKDNLDETGEVWLQQGVEYAKTDKCPFCGRGGLSTVESVGHFRAYFDERYASLREEVDNCHDAVGISLPETIKGDLETAIARNSMQTDFWGKHIAVDLPDAEVENLVGRMKRLKLATQELLFDKSMRPLERVVTDEVYRTIVGEFFDAVKTTENYNKKVKTVNAAIDKKKEDVRTGNLKKAQDELQQLTLVKTRQSENVTTFCDSLTKTRRKKKALESKKTDLKGELDQFVKDTLSQYRECINQYLCEFGAGFNIKVIGRSYPGGRASATYALSINDEGVDLGDSTTSDGVPCFKNTLSDGDRRTLGLAFFLARLHNDPTLSTKLIVLDDPVASLDLLRQSHAVNCIVSLANRAKGVLVLSHDPCFCNTVLREIRGSEPKALKIVRVKQNESAIVEWNPEVDTRTPYLKDFHAIKEYLDCTSCESRESVARRIRPMLEENLTLRFPGKFAANDSLGTCIGMIRGADPSDILHRLQPVLHEYEDINRFSNPFHHKTNLTGWQTATTTDSELSTYAKRAMKLLSGVQ